MTDDEQAEADFNALVQEARRRRDETERKPKKQRYSNGNGHAEEEELPPLPQPVSAAEFLARADCAA